MAEGKGICPHGEFDLMKGCPQCMADRDGVEGNTEDSIAKGIEEANQRTEKKTGSPLVDAIIEADPEVEVKVVTMTEETETTALITKLDQDVVVISLVEQANKYLEYAQGRVVSSADGVKGATADLSLIANTKKAIEGKRQEYVRPLNEQVKEINTFFKTLTKPITEADKITRGKVLDYNKEIELRRQEAQRIEDERFRLAQDEMKLSGEFTLELTPVEKPDATPQRVRTEVGVISKSVVWKYEVVNFALLPDEFKVEDTALLNATVKKHHDSKQILGVRIYSEDSLVVRAS